MLGSRRFVGQLVSGLGLWHTMAGIYAEQVMEGDGAWSAEISLQVIAASRTREWRHRHHLQRDSVGSFTP